TGDAVIISAFVAGIGRRPAVRGLDQPGLHHACQCAVHRPHVRHRCFAARFDVLNDSVAVPFPGRETEEDVKLDTPQWQILLNPPVPIHALNASLESSVCVTHIVLSRRTSRATPSHDSPSPEWRTVAGNLPPPAAAPGVFHPGPMAPGSY